MDYNLVVIDGAPRVNELARSAILASDLVLIPVQPSPFDVWAAAETVAQRMRREPGVFEVDTIREADRDRLTFVPDQEKAAIAGVSVDAIAQTIATALGGNRDQTIRVEGERLP